METLSSTHDKSFVLNSPKSSRADGNNWFAFFAEWKARVEVVAARIGSINIANASKQKLFQFRSTHFKCVSRQEMFYTLQRITSKNILFLRMFFFEQKRDCRLAKLAKLMTCNQGKWGKMWKMKTRAMSLFLLNEIFMMRTDARCLSSCYWNWALSSITHRADYLTLSSFITSLFTHDGRFFSSFFTHAAQLRSFCCDSKGKQIELLN